MLRILGLRGKGLRWRVRPTARRAIRRLEIGKNMNQNQWQGNGVEPYSPFEAQQTKKPARELSLRSYGLALTGLVLAGFVVMGVCATLFTSPSFLFTVMDHYLGIAIGSAVLSIAGIIMMSVARKNESVGLSLAGYAVFVLSFGFTASSIALVYTSQSISTAFLATAGITAVFACLGIAFPNFFAKIQSILFGGLLAVLLVSVVMSFMGVYTTAIDYVVIAIFCGFIGWDFYKAMSDEPTLVNAVYNASQLFLDIINVFVRVLSIVGRRND